MPTCNQCTGPLVWATHHHSGKRIPFNAAGDAEPFRHGSYAIIDGVAYGAIKAPEALALKEGICEQRAEALLQELPWHTSHLTHCPAYRKAATVGGVARG